MRLPEIINNWSNIKILDFKRVSGSGFSFTFEKDLEASEVIIVQLPAVSANMRGINDIGWLSDGNVTVYGSLSRKPKSEKALWQEIRENDEVNKVTSFIAIVNNGGACRIEMRAIFN
jgi:hypothetical protein